MTSNRLSLIKAAPLFLVLIIDSMGLGLLFPIVNALIMDPATHFLNPATTLLWREFYYGLVLGIFMLCWFFGATIMGDLSDNIGRKKSLLLCLFGAFGGYVLSAVAISMQSLGLLILGRVIAGFTAGSEPIAQAAIVDVSSPQDKARNLGYITLAISLGFVFGPICGGVLSEPRIFPEASFAMPMYFAALLSLVNALMLWWFFDETYQSSGKVKIAPQRALHLFVAAFKHHRIAELSSVLLLMIIGWSSYFSFIPLYMFQRYHFSMLQSSMFFALMGVGFSISCGYLVGKLSDRYDMQRTVVVSFFLSGVLILISLLFQYEFVAWAVAFLVGLVMGVGYAELLTLFSDQVGPDEQGWVMGITGSVMALCFAVVDILTGLIARYGAATPMIAAVIGFIASAVVLWRVKLVVEQNEIAAIHQELK